MKEVNSMMLARLTEALGQNLQLVNVNKECAEMQLLVSELLRGGQVDRRVFTDSVADLYVMMNALVQMYSLNADEIEQIAEAKLTDSLRALGLVEEETVSAQPVATEPVAAPAPVPASASASDVPSAPEAEAVNTSAEPGIQVSVGPADVPAPSAPAE